MVIKNRVIQIMDYPILFLAVYFTDYQRIKIIKNKVENKEMDS